ncbi:MAG: exodeoxyribonuclease VII small subunit [Thermoplasmata archaeon]
MMHKDEEKKMEKEYSFEAALKKLEEIVERLESGELSLQEMVSNFEEGMKLSLYCKKILIEVQGKVEKIIDENGIIKTEEFPNRF